VLAGYDEAGGGRGYRPVDHSDAIEATGGELSEALRAGWLPKITNGWFFKAESFFSVARYLDAVGSPSADFLSYSHGEGFMRFFEERCRARASSSSTSRNPRCRRRKLIVRFRREAMARGSP
jgi:predicted ATPase